MAGIRRVMVKIRGRVQGVGFRYFVQRAARARKLSGYVRNEADGSVVVEAQGLESGLEALLQELQFGPSSATVERIHADWLEPVKFEGEFSIRF
jgi:acylphosphatase